MNIITVIQYQYDGVTKRTAHQYFERTLHNVHMGTQYTQYIYKNLQKILKLQTKLQHPE